MDGSRPALRGVAVEADKRKKRVAIVWVPGQVLFGLTSANPSVMKTCIVWCQMAGSTLSPLPSLPRRPHRSARLTTARGFGLRFSNLVGEMLLLNQARGARGKAALWRGGREPC